VRLGRRSTVTFPPNPRPYQPPPHPTYPIVPDSAVSPRLDRSGAYLSDNTPIGEDMTEVGSVRSEPPSRVVPRRPQTTNYVTPPLPGAFEEVADPLPFHVATPRLHNPYEDIAALLPRRQPLRPSASAEPIVTTLRDESHERELPKLPQDNLTQRPSRRGGSRKRSLVPPG